MRAGNSCPLKRIKFLKEQKGNLISPSLYVSSVPIQDTQFRSPLTLPRLPITPWLSSILPPPPLARDLSIHPPWQGLESRHNLPHVGIGSMLRHLRTTTKPRTLTPPSLLTCLSAPASLLAWSISHRWGPRAPCWRRVCFACWWSRSLAFQLKEKQVCACLWAGRKAFPLGEPLPVWVGGVELRGQFVCYLHITHCFCSPNLV